MTPHEEAANILKEVLDDLIDRNHDLRSILLKCQHVCELVGWHDKKLWFHQELNGYSYGSELPVYRKVFGTEQWSENTYSRLTRVTLAIKKDSAPSVNPEPKHAILDVYAGIDWIIQRSFLTLCRAMSGWFFSTRIISERSRGTT